MQKVKRVKGGKVAWAAKFDPAGNVLAWVPRESDAFEIRDEALAANIAMHYRTLANCGALSFEPIGKPINDAAKASAVEAARSKATENDMALTLDRASRFVAAEAGRVAAEEKLAKVEAELLALKAAKVEPVAVFAPPSTDAVDPQKQTAPEPVQTDHSKGKKK